MAVQNGCCNVATFGTLLQEIEMVSRITVLITAKDKFSYIYMVLGALSTETGRRDKPAFQV